MAENLWSRVIAEANLNVAWAKVCANQGAAGGDGVTINGCMSGQPLPDGNPFRKNTSRIHTGNNVSQRLNTKQSKNPIPKTDQFWDPVSNMLIFRQKKFCLDSDNFDTM